MTHPPDVTAFCTPPSPSLTGSLSSTPWDGVTQTFNRPTIILGPSTVDLIDFALAQGPYPLPSDVAYRGGMVHFTVPETAAHLLATPDEQSIAIDEPAEVYALAAVLHLAWTGLPPTT